MKKILVLAVITAVFAIPEVKAQDPCMICIYRCISLPIDEIGRCIAEECNTTVCNVMENQDEEVSIPEAFQKNALQAVTSSNESEVVYSLNKYLFVQEENETEIFGKKTRDKETKEN